MTGQLYLGVFSGPVEGILMIIVVFTISGIYGKPSHAPSLSRAHIFLRKARRSGTKACLNSRDSIACPDSPPFVTLV